MKKILVLLATVVAGCSAQSPDQEMTGMPNPASVHCKERGGTSEIVRTPEGESGYCTLPSGERVEEWTLYRRDGK